MLLGFPRFFTPGMLSLIHVDDFHAIMHYTQPYCSADCMPAPTFYWELLSEDATPFLSGSFYCLVFVAYISIYNFYSVSVLLTYFFRNQQYLVIKLNFLLTDSTDYVILSTVCPAAAVKRSQRNSRPSRNASRKALLLRDTGITIMIISESYFTTYEVVVGTS